MKNSYLLFMLLIVSTFSALPVCADHVCVQDINNNGYAGEPGETDICVSNAKKTAFYCPIGAVACDKVNEVTTLPSVKECPSGYALSADQTKCTKLNMLEQPVSNNCPPSYSYNASKALCEVGSTTTSPPVLSCPTGYVLSADGKTCTKTGYTYQPVINNCPSGYSYNTSLKLCEKGSVVTTAPSFSCPSGQTQSNGRCFGPGSTQCGASNPARSCMVQGGQTGIVDYGTGSWNWRWGSLSASTPVGTYSVSAGGYLYVFGDTQVEDWNYTTYEICKCPAQSNVDMGDAITSCPSGYNYNSSTKLCYKGATDTTGVTKSCPSGYTYNVTSDNCEKQEVITVPVAVSCADGTYSAATNQCEKATILTQPSTKVCPSDFTYNTSRGVCEKTEVVTIAVSHKCENGYTYNPASGVCEHFELVDSCPLSGGGVCVQGAGAIAYCSPNPCMDRKDEQTIGNIDGNMQVDNGEIDEEGVCTDQVMIFTGRASECLPSGKSTAFQNCCKNTGEITNDSVGSKNMVGNGIQVIKYVYQVSAAAAGAYTNAINAGASQAQAANAATSAAQSQVQALMNPATIAWAVAIYLVVDYLMQACDTLSMETSMAADSGFCHELGTYCKTKWLGQCVQKAKSYCCFNSKMARIIHEQGRPQLKNFNGFGNTSSPECRGFSPEEFQALDFSKIDMTEYYDDLVHNTQQNIQDSINNMTKDYYESVK